MTNDIREQWINRDSHCLYLLFAETTSTVSPSARRENKTARGKKRSCSLAYLVTLRKKGSCNLYPKMNGYCMYFQKESVLAG